jgi:hypothetical protein
MAGESLTSNAKRNRFTKASKEKPLSQNGFGQSATQPAGTSSDKPDFGHNGELSRDGL